MCHQPSTQHLDLVEDPKEMFFPAWVAGSWHRACVSGLLFIFPHGAREGKWGDLLAQHFGGEAASCCPWLWAQIPGAELRSDLRICLKRQEKGLGLRCLCYKHLPPLRRSLLSLSQSQEWDGSAQALLGQVVFPILMAPLPSPAHTTRAAPRATQSSCFHNLWLL